MAADVDELDAIEVGTLAPIVRHCLQNGAARDFDLRHGVGPGAVGAGPEDAAFGRIEHDGGVMKQVLRHGELRRLEFEADGQVVHLLNGVCVPQFMPRSEEHTSELQSLMRNSYAVFCLKKKKNK